jgi:hypothetical protein
MSECCCGASRPSRRFVGLLLFGHAWVLCRHALGLLARPWVLCRRALVLCCHPRGLHGHALVLLGRPSALCGRALWLCCHPRVLHGHAFVLFARPWVLRVRCGVRCVRLLVLFIHRAVRCERLLILLVDWLVLMLHELVSGRPRLMLLLYSLVLWVSQSALFTPSKLLSSHWSAREARRTPRGLRCAELRAVRASLVSGVRPSDRLVTARSSHWPRLGWRALRRSTTESLVPRPLTASALSDVPGMTERRSCVVSAPAEVRGRIHQSAAREAQTPSSGLGLRRDAVITALSGGVTSIGLSIRFVLRPAWRGVKVLVDCAPSTNRSRIL